jgi:FkbM family methyltransferase
MEIVAKLSERVPQSWFRAFVHARNSNRFVRWSSEWFAELLRNRIVRVASGPAKGLLFDAGSTSTNIGLPSFEPDLLHSLEILLKPRMNVFDVGACFGFLSMVAARMVGPAGMVVGFEPVAGNRTVFERNAEVNGLSNLKLLPQALCDYDGEMQFWLTENPFVGSLENLANEPPQAQGKVTVEANRMDTVFREAALPPPDLIKIDVEGAEASVLRGGEQTINRFRPVLLIELHGSSEPVVNELRRLGYVASLFGSSRGVEGAHGNIHIVALPQEREDCAAMLRIFGDHNFPRCDRCMALSV